VLPLKFSNAIQTALRLLIVGLLIYPFPIAVADHVPTQAPYGVNASNDANAGTFTIGILSSDGWEDSPPENYTIFFSQSSGITETNSFCVTTSFGHSTNNWQYYTFSLDDLKYYFNDPAGTNIYYRVRSNNITDYSFSTLTNQNSWNLYAGPPFEFNQTDWSAPTGTDACDDPKILDGTPAPTTPTVQVNYKEGTVTVDWDIPSQTYQYPPERYAIGFGLADDGSMPYAVSTGNVGDTNALNTEYTFTADYLNTTFNEAHGLFNVKIRSDNDTNSSYSAWSSTVQTTIQNKPAWVDDFSYTLSNTGALISWTKDDTGFVPVDNFKIWVREGDGEWTLVTTLSNTTTSFAVGHTSVTEDTQFQWNLQACGSEGDCNTAGPITYTWEYVEPTLGPPMNTEASNVYNSGVRVKWDAPNTGNQTADTYELYYRTSPTDEVVIYNISNTEYTIPYANIPNGTYTFSIRAFDSDYNVYSGYSTEPTLEVFNQKAQDDADAAAAAAEAARKAEEERIAREKAEAEAELQRQRDKNLSETGYSETDAERSAREQKEYEEEQARLKALEEERIRNSDETGYYETDQERADREQREYEEEQARLAELERQRVKNEAETGYYETDAERSERERLEVEEAAKKAIEAATKSTTDNGEGDGEPLSKEDQDKLDKLVDTIIELKKTLVTVEVPDAEPIELPKEIVVVTTTTTTTTTIPIIEDFADEEDDNTEQVEDNSLSSEEGDTEIQPTELTDEEVEVLVEAAEEAITEVVEVEELTEVFEDKAIEIIEEEELETLSEEEVEAYEEAVEEAVAEVVAELGTEEKVEVVKEVAKVSVQNLGNADTTTKAVVKAVVKEVTKVETVAELDEEEKQAVGEVLGFSEETAAQDVEIIAEAAAKEETIATAVDEYVERAIENEDVEDFTLADVVVEVQVEVFLSDPVGAIIDVDLENIDFATIGQDMTQDQRQKSKEVVVPVIIASQIVAQAGALITRRPF
jgi:hypothetical protein